MGSVPTSSYVLGLSLFLCPTHLGFEALEPISVSMEPTTNNATTKKLLLVTPWPPDLTSR